ncbi:hypothetical protein ASD18_12185 [Cellulomonas sp. Root137]|nr:hypothetical protein ASD18_12185 [Cellulomonas sp. Root137]
MQEVVGRELDDSIVEGSGVRNVANFLGVERLTSAIEPHEDFVLHPIGRLPKDYDGTKRAHPERGRVFRPEIAVAQTFKVATQLQFCQWKFVIDELDYGRQPLLSVDHGINASRFLGQVYGRDRDIQEEGFN